MTSKRDWVILDSKDLLDLLLQDEFELLSFTSEHAIRPEAVMLARSKLPGFNHDF